MAVPRTVRGRSVLLLDQLRELLVAVESGEVPGAGPAYRHRVQGGIIEHSRWKTASTNLDTYWCTTTYSP